MKNPSHQPKKLPKQERSAATVDTILEAAAHILEAKNLDFALTTNQIAERAGVSIGSVYQYIPNKQSILTALAERYLDLKTAEILKKALSVKDLPLEDAISQLLNFIIGMKIKRRKLELGLLRWFIQTGSFDLLRGTDRRMISALEEILQVFSAKLPRALDPEWGAFILFQSVRGVLVSAQWHEDRAMGLESVKAELQRLILGYFRT